MSLHYVPDKEGLIKIGLTLEEAENFSRVHNRYTAILQSGGQYLNWGKTTPFASDRTLSHETLPQPAEADIPAMLNKVVVVKLNGGLGTRMGLVSPKSMIEVRGDLTFLDIAVKQVEYFNNKYNVDIPLALMNSFHTDKATRKIVKKYGKRRVPIVCFEQSRFPRIYKDTLRPLPKPIGKKDKEEDKKHWFPPGSGDVFRSLSRSGLLEQFTKSGKEYIFISNVENLGGCLDLKILSRMISKKDEFCIETTERAATDTVGSILVSESGVTKLLECSQIPPELTETFSAAEYKDWNTNNMWVSISALQTLLAQDKVTLNFVVNHRVVDHIPVIQLETPAGSIVENVSSSQIIRVPRNRMRNVKNTANLFPLQSNLFDLREDGQLIMSPHRAFPSIPVIKFGDQFTHIADYQRRFAQGQPDILELDRLTVSGDVTFGHGVSLKGIVVIVANPGEKIDVPSGCVLENKIVSGNLRILEH